MCEATPGALAPVRQAKILDLESVANLDPIRCKNVHQVFGDYWVLCLPVATRDERGHGTVLYHPCESYKVVAGLVEGLTAGEVQVSLRTAPNLQRSLNLER